MQVLTTRKDNGDMMNGPVLEEVADAHKFISENLTAVATTIHDNLTVEMKYRELCGVYCSDSNSGIIALLQTIVESRSSSSTPSSFLRLTYPNVESLHTRIYIGYSLGHLIFNTTNEDDSFIAAEARLLILHYMVNTSLPAGRQLANDFEAKLFSILERLTAISSNLNYEFLSRNREIKEQSQITIVTIPYLAMTVVVLTLFMICTLIDFPLYRSQHLESLIGVLSPGMALYTTTGLLWGLGYPFSNILTVVPFLVVTIGIDDAFLILAGWRHSTRGASLEHRLGESLTIAGASVTVTSVTDVLCFSIGLFSNLPVVRLFCLYTTVALFLDYLYQLTFFTSLVGLCCRRQVLLDRTEIESPSIFKSKTKHKPSSATAMAESPESVRKSGWLEVYIDWLHGWPSKCFISIVFSLHIGMSSWLATNVNTAFDMENLYLHSSPLTHISRTMQNHVLQEAFTVNFGVYPMPDFSDQRVRSQFEEMLSCLETIPHFTFPPGTATNVWTRDFANAVAFWEEEDGFWSADELVQNYREYDLEEKYINIRVDDEGKEWMDGFFFTITYRNFSSFLEVEVLMEMRRAILAEYADSFVVHSHHPFEKVPTESAASAPANFLQTAVSAIVLMSVLVSVFVLDAEAVLSVVVSILSICLGTVSYLHVWGVNLDAVALISTLMSIGFSVDYSAHICYHYYAHALDQQQQGQNNAIELSESSSAEEQSDDWRRKKSCHRLLLTLQGVAWPVLQSGLSTVLGMVPLVFVEAYVVAVFWKTVILVGVLGMAHALLLLPTLFILSDDVKAIFRRCFLFSSSFRRPKVSAEEQRRNVERANGLSRATKCL